MKHPLAVAAVLFSISGGLTMATVAGAMASEPEKVVV